MTNELPQGFDPAEPLRDARYERFAHLRVIGVPAQQAGREAGFVTKKGRPWLAGNIARLDRHPEVVARKAFLAGHETAVVRETRGFVRNRLMSVASLDILRDYAVLGEIEVNGKKVVRIVGIDWNAFKASEHSVAVSGFKFDRETGMMVEFETNDAMNAVAQLRDMYGLRAARRTELTGKDGAAIDAALTVRYDISDKPLSPDEWASQYAGAAEGAQA